MKMSVFCFACLGFLSAASSAYAQIPSEDAQTVTVTVSVTLNRVDDENCAVAVVVVQDAPTEKEKKKRGAALFFHQPGDSEPSQTATVTVPSGTDTPVPTNIRLRHGEEILLCVRADHADRDRWFRLTGDGSVVDIPAPDFTKESRVPEEQPAGSSNPRLLPLTLSTGYGWLFWSNDAGIDDSGAWTVSLLYDASDRIKIGLDVLVSTETDAWVVNKVDGGIHGGTVETHAEESADMVVMRLGIGTELLEIGDGASVDVLCGPVVALLEVDDTRNADMLGGSAGLRMNCRITGRFSAGLDAGLIVLPTRNAWHSEELTEGAFVGITFGCGF
jgi:hypothetical protein